MLTSRLAQLLVVVVGVQILALVVYAVVRRPQRGVLLLAALTPFDGLLLLVPHPAIVDGWKEALLLLVLVAALLAPVGVRVRDPLPWPPWTIPVLGFVAVGLASAVVVQGTQSLVGLKLNAFYALLLPVLYWCPLSSVERDRLVSIMMSVGVVTAAVGLLQQVVGAEALFRLGYEYNETIRTAGGLLRSFSTFNQPFPFAFYLMLVLLIGLPAALVDLRRPRNLLFLASTPLIILGMFSSIVRAAILGFLVGAVFLWWHRYRLLAHLVPPALASLLLVPLGTYTTLLSASSFGERTEGWSQTIDRVVAAPLGNGIGSTGSAAEKTALLSGGLTPGYQPDNYYFKTVFELGPLGLWMFGLLLVGAFLHARQTSKQLHDPAGPSASGARGPALSRARDAALAAGIAATLLAAAAASVVATYLEIFPIDLYFWLLLGVLTSLRHESPMEPSRCDRAAAASRPTSVASSGSSQP